MTIAKVLAVYRVSPPLLVVEAEDGTVLERSLTELTAGGYRFIGGVCASTPTASPWWRATASPRPRPPAPAGAGTRVMQKGSPRAARWSSGPRAAAAMSIYAPGGTPWRARRWAIADHRVVWRLWSEAWPSSGVPPLGTARAPQRGERTHGWRAGRCSWLSPSGIRPGTSCPSGHSSSPQTRWAVVAQCPSRRAKPNRVPARTAQAGQRFRGPMASRRWRTRPTAASCKVCGGRGPGPRAGPRLDAHSTRPSGRAGCDHGAYPTPVPAQQGRRPPPSPAARRDGSG
jgi:hypothetical protein